MVDGVPLRLRDFTPEAVISLTHRVALDGPDQIEASSASLEELIAFFDQFITGDGGGTVVTLTNTGTGAGIFSAMVGSAANLRSLRSTTSALAITQGSSEVTFTIASASGASNGLMSSSDKAKLDALPGSIALATNSTHGLMSNTDKVKLDALPGSIPEATTSLPGLMSAPDKLKLDGISGGGGGTTTLLTNIGAGAGVYSSTIGDTAQLRTIRSTSPALTVTQASTEITMFVAAATVSSSGLMSAVDKSKLDALPGSLPLASSSVPGLMSNTDKVKLDDLPGSIPIATTGAPGLMSAPDKLKLDGLSGGGGGTTQIANIGTGAGVYSHLVGSIAQLRSLLSSTSALSISQGGNDISFGITAATTSNSGLMSSADKSKLDALPGSIPVASSGVTGLMLNTDKVKLDNLPGSIPVATTSVAGFMSAADKVKLDGLSGGGTTTLLENIGTGAAVYASTVVNTAQIRTLRSTSSPLTITQSSTELSFAIANVGVSTAGLMSIADKSKLDALPGSIPVASSSVTGLMTNTDKVKLDNLPSSIPVATTTVAGFMSAADKVKLDGLSGGGTTTLLANIGTGAAVYASTVADTAQIRTLRSTSTPLTITQSSTELSFAIASVSVSTAGLMSIADKAKLDALPGSIPVASSSVTGLMLNTDKVKLDNLPASIPLATTSVAGFMSAADKLKLDGLSGGGTTTLLANIGTGAGVYASTVADTAQLRSLRSTTSALVVTQAASELNLSIASASPTVTGLMLAADKSKLDALPGSLPLATTSISGLMSNTDKVKLNDLPGSIPVATNSLPGLMSAPDKLKLDGLPEGGIGTTLSNLGAGAGVFASMVGTNAQLRSLRSTASPLSVTQAATEITFSISAASGSTAGTMSISDKLKLDALPGSLPLATTSVSGLMSNTDKVKLDALPSSIPVATTSVSGLMSAADKLKLDGISGGGGGTTLIENIGTGATIYAGLSGSTAQLRSVRSLTSALSVTQAATEITLAVGTVTGSVSGLMSSADKLKLDALPGSLPLATTSVSGLMSNTDKVKLDDLPGSLPIATTSLPGLMSTSDKVKLDGLPGSLPVATTSASGLMSAADKTKLNALPGSIPVVTTVANGLMLATDKVKLDGLPGTIPVATTSVSGLMSNADKTKLDGLPGSIGLASASADGLMAIADKTKLDALPASVETVVLAQLGTAAHVYSGKVGGVHQFRSIRSNSPPLTVAQGTNEISLSIATVTGSAPGLMSAADKTQLDALVAGTPPEPLPPAIIDFVVNNNSATSINLSADTPEGTWFVLSDASNADVSVLVICDFINAKTSLYSAPGGGIDLVASYGKFKAATGILTGTTGTAGFISISATAAYQVYLENRTGVNMVLRYFQTGVGGGGGGAVALNQLIDVNLTGLANGNVLTYDQASGRWVPGVGGGGTGTYPRDAAFDSFTVGDEIAGNRVAHFYDTASGSYQITPFQGSASSLLEITADGELNFNGESLLPSLALSEAITQCQGFRDEAVVARDLALEYSDLSRRWASDPVGSPISGGLFSSYAYSQIALQTSSASRILPSKIITDSDLVSGKYTLKSGDLFLILAFRNTAACQLVCPPNLWRNNKGEAWVMVRREGALVTVVNATGSVTAPLHLASRSMLRRFPVMLAAPEQFSEVITLPAMVNGKIHIGVHSVHNTTGTKNLTLVSPTPLIPAPANIFSDSGYVGASEALKQNSWECNIASYAGGDVTFTLTLPAGCLAAVGMITAINNAGTREDNLTSLKSAGPSSTIQTGSTTTNGPSRLTLGVFAQRSHTALPATISGGMFQDVVASTVGTASGSDADRFGNIGSVSGYEIVPGVVAPAAGENRNYGCVFNGADGPTSAIYCAYPPFTATSVSSAIRAANGDPTITNVDGVGMLHASPDGLTYFFNAG